MRTLLLILLLSGCATTSNKTGDPILINWIKVSEQSEVFYECNKVYPLFKSQYAFNVVGCYYYSDNICNVVAIDSPSTFHELGHEIKHCFDGQFHDGQFHDDPSKFKAYYYKREYPIKHLK